MTFDKVGAWAITEPDSGSDALGGMKSTAVRDGDEYVLNGNKTFITNGPFADTIVFYAKLDDGSDTPLRQRPVLTFILDSGMPGLEQSKPFRKMGLHSSPTGELFLSDVRVGRERLLGETEGRSGGDVAGSDRGVPQVVDPVRQGPAFVGASDLGVPADPAEAGQDGDRPVERREPGVPPRRDGGGG
jgi:hypothetical protein